MNEKLKEGLAYMEVWKSCYRGVDFEINYLQRNFGKWYTCYLIIIQHRMEENVYSKIFRNKKGYNYPEIVNFHYGCTYFEKYKNHVKIGCDYNHSGDDVAGHTLDSVLDDVKGYIDEFLEKYKYLRWCGNCGKVTEVSEGQVLSEDISSYSFKCNNCINKSK